MQNHLNYARYGRMKDGKRKEMSGANNEWGFPYRLFYMNLQGVVFTKIQT